ncbi:MAG: hypothetical protein ACI4PW_05215 [Alphaproteobacteria bacterium]
MNETADKQAEKQRRKFDRQAEMLRQNLVRRRRQIEERRLIGELGNPPAEQSDADGGIYDLPNGPE